MPFFGSTPLSVGFLRGKMRSLLQNDHLLCGIIARADHNSDLCLEVTV